MKLFSYIFINFEICYPKVINKEMWARVLPCVNVCVFLLKCSLLCSFILVFFFFIFFVAFFFSFGIHFAKFSAVIFRERNEKQSKLISCKFFMILSHLHRYLTFKIVCISLWNCTFGVAHKSLLVPLFCIYSLFLFAFLLGLHRAFNFSRKFNVQMIIKTFSIAVIWLVWTPTDTAETAWHFKGIQLCYHLSKSLKATAPFVHRVFGVRATKKKRIMEDREEEKKK